MSKPNTVSDDCFKTFTDGHTVDDKTVACGVDSFGVKQQTCSGMTRADQVGVQCRFACSQKGNQALCLANSTEYCGKNQGSTDCKCLFPANTSVLANGQTINYNDLQKFVGAQNFGFDARCMYKGCSSGLATVVIQDPALTDSCPHTDVFCSVSNVTITIGSIRAGNIDPVQQNCGAQAKGGKQSGQGQGQNQQPLKHKILPYALGGAALVVLLVVAVVVAVVHERHLHEAQRKMLYSAQVLLSQEATLSKKRL